MYNISIQGRGDTSKTHVGSPYFRTSNSTVVSGSRKMAAGFNAHFLVFLFLVPKVGGIAVDDVRRDNPLGKSCPRCTSIEDKTTIDNIRTEVVKQQILSKLGLKQKPNITAAIPRDLAIETLLRADRGRQSFEEVGKTRTNRDEGDDYFARTSEIISFAETGGLQNGKTLLEFSIAHDNPNSLQVTSAILWLQLRFRLSTTKHPRHIFRERKVTIYVFCVLIENNTSTDNLDSLNGQLIASQRVIFKHLEWNRLNVELSVKKWFEGPINEKLRLLVDCRDCNNLVEPVLMDQVLNHKKKHTTATALQRQRPFLVIRTTPRPSHRQKRRANDCDVKTAKCCKQTLYVSFNMLKWDDWIIAPQGYYANYCIGDCTRREVDVNAFNNFYSHVIEEYRTANPYSSIQPCCAPTKLAPMSLIYFDKDLNIIKTDLPNMVVDECGCT